MSHKRLALVLSLIVAVLLTGGWFMLGTGRLQANDLAKAQATAGIPELMTYQGYLTDSGGAPLDGSYSLTFKIYDAGSGGTLTWEETHAGVAVNSGYFAVMLGSQGAPLTPGAFSGESRYMQVSVGGDDPLPRQRMAAAPYAFQAYRAQTALEATYATTATVALNAGGAYENVIVVAKSGGDHTSVAMALSSISTPSATNRYLVYVAPGVYTESELVDVKPYVHLQGAGPNVSVVTSTRADSSAGVDAATAQVQDQGRISDLAIYNDATSATAVAVYMGEGVTRATRLDNVTAKARGAGGSAHYAVYLNDAEPTIVDSWLAATGAVSLTDNIGIGSKNVSSGFPQAVIRGSTILGGIDDEISCATQTGIALKLTESTPTIYESYICGGQRAILLETSGFPTLHNSTVRVSSTNGAALVETTAGGIVSIAGSRVDNFNGVNVGTAPRCVYAYDFGAYSELDQNCDN